MGSPTSPVFSDDDRAHMRAALSLAKRGLGSVAPNPAVGCVLVRPDLGDRGRVVGRGWTQPGGRPHAETEAIRRAGDLANSSHAFVTLEPCNHQGQTGPCTEALITAGVQSVTVALSDPDPRVCGTGIERLKHAGLTVRTGLLEDEARALNAGFLSVQEHNRPWITLKIATSADGMIAAKKGEQLWITGTAARARGHLMRAQNDAILTGVGTVVADNPELTCRLPGLEHLSPQRFIIDGNARTPADAKVLARNEGRETVLYVSKTADEPRIEGLLKAGQHLVPIEADNGRFDIPSLLEEIAARGITRLMIESGQGINSAFLKTGLIDEIAWFRAPSVIGEQGVRVFDVEESEYPDQSGAFRLSSAIGLDDDRLERYLRVR